uniref:NAD-dependent epimerase/dehydratase domain-containing protein n=1 Tax=Aegilops tauschii subsp. strangulata TaxID=200361 RepID=A0A453Q0E3_AEGTS
GGNGDEKHLVCVTGAGSFIGSWVVKELLLRGYRVRGTARDPELVPTAVEGTRNVINAAADAGVRRVVFTSSYGAVHMDPNRSPDTVLDESCWSDYDYCKQTGNLYCCAKMMAEVVATEEAAKRGLELAVVVPAVTIGPSLQQTLNYSTDHVARFLTGAKPAYQNTVTGYIDVRDVARAHALVYEHPDARGHRYLCVSAVLHRTDFVGLLRDLYPQYPVTAK